MHLARESRWDRYRLLHAPPVREESPNETPMGVLGQDALEDIASYKYHAGTYTWLDLKMTPYWNFVVEFLPMWMAPNLVTLMGTIVTTVTTCVVLYFSPHLTEEAPRWAYVLCAIGMFTYQTLDAIDGKQARRTGSSSPLGQLFDHGMYPCMRNVFVT